MAALVLYMRLPPKLTFGPVWVAPALVLILLIPLLIADTRREKLSRQIRVGSIALIAVLNFFNITSVGLLINDLVNSHVPAHSAVNAQGLLGAGAVIWVTNVIVFALWYWELDSGGPTPREKAGSAAEFASADFLFPQMTIDKTKVACVDVRWKPLLLDYLYVSATNALAFSPTDTMPLSRMAKTLMMVESLISFATVGLILARSVNILS